MHVLNDSLLALQSTPTKRERKRFREKEKYRELPG